MSPSKSRPEAFDISVIIPCRNGGADLIMLAESLLSQNNCNLEIIIIDSGSTDGSEIVVHKSSKIKWISIEPSAFSHSATRNLGLSMAQHPLVFFTVQDAKLQGSSDLFRACELLVRHDLSALSLAESPREDADQYAKFALHSYYHGMYQGGAKTLIHDDWVGGKREKVIAASLGNVACLCKRELLLDYPFAGSFAEDFDLAVRLLKAGKRVGKTKEVEVVHSHTRPAFYALQRNYLSEKLMRSHNLSAQLGPVPEELAIGAAGQLIMIFGRSYLQSQDPRLDSLLETLVDGKVSPVQNDLIFKKIEDLAHWFEPKDPNDQPEFRLKLLAGYLGQLIGGVDLGAWSNPKVRAIVQNLGLGV